MTDAFRSADGFAVYLAGAAFGAGCGGLGRGESQAFVEDASSAGISAGVVDAEGHHFDDARAGNEPADRLCHERTANALPACSRGYDQPVHVIGRRRYPKKQTAEQIRLIGGDRDKGRGTSDVLADSSAETWVANHGAEPVLDLSCQVDEARYILLTGGSDDHLNSLAVVRQ
jgi:hypothetical protein